MVHWLLVLNLGPLNKCVSVVCTVCLLYLFIQSNLPYKPHPKREYLVVAYENWTTSKGSLPRREQISSTLFCKRIHCMQLLSYDMCSFIGFWYILRSIMHTAITKSDNASSGRLKEVNWKQFNSLRRWSSTRGSNCKDLSGNILRWSHIEVRLYRLLMILLARLVWWCPGGLTSPTRIKFNFTSFRDN